MDHNCPKHPHRNIDLIPASQKIGRPRTLARVIVSCQLEGCPISWEATTSRLAEGKAKYCCKEHFDIAQTFERVTKICLYSLCGQAFDVHPTDAKRGKGQFCCDEHRVLGLKERRPETTRFWEKVAVCEHGRSCTQCCRPWQGALNFGYGAFGITVAGESRMKPAHVYAWEIVNGPMPPDKQGNHIRECPLRACCNPAHVYAGTKKENTQDALAVGTIHGSLTEMDVRTIRQLASTYTGKITIFDREMARRFHVSSITIAAIRRGERYKHIV